MLPTDDDVAESETPVRRLLRALATDPDLGHGTGGYHRVEYWPGGPPSADDLAELGIGPDGVVVLVEDEDELPEVADTVPAGVRVTPARDGCGDCVYLVSGPFDSVTAAVLDGAPDDPGGEPDEESLTDGDRAALDTLTDPAVRRWARGLLTMPVAVVLGDPTDDFYLEQVPDAFPDSVFVFGSSAEPPLHDFAFCVIRTR